MHYRVYLFNEDAHIRAAESFSSSNNEEAGAVAALIYQACCDEFASYEVWRDATPVHVRDPDGEKRHSLDLESITESRQANVLELEERLQRNFDCVKRSQRLLEVSNELRCRISDR